MKSTDNPLVCFFDSGIGGLNLLRESVRRLPRVDFTYFADNDRVPYGALDKDELIKLTDKIFCEIAEVNPAAAVVACNTVTARCIDFLREKYPFDIIGIQPAIKPAAAVGGKVLVLATPSTASSSSLKSLADKYGDGRTRIVACPDLADYVERNVNNITYEAVTKLLPDVKTDCVVLGCTHYAFISEQIKKFYNCPVYDGIEGTAERLCEKLGIFDHCAPRAQKITFSGGDEVKNREIFRLLIKQSNALTLS